jgi:uncharacterized protein (TIGR02646 family)
MRIIGNPSRTNKDEKTPYSKHRETLRKDFNFRCGYCDVCEGTEGLDNFEIDHFRPIHKKAYPHLKDHYSNLVYSCKTCNRGKSSRWKEEYVDPCNQNYDDNFHRNIYGKIFPTTDNGKIMWKDLKFYLLKRKFCWQISQLIYLIHTLESLKKEYSLPENIFIELEGKYKELEIYLSKLILIKHCQTDPLYLLCQN